MSFNPTIHNFIRLFLILNLSNFQPGTWNNFVTALNILDQPPQRQICIVGAGITGLSLGHLLQARNYSVVILEKFDTVGGKMLTHRDSYGGDQIQAEMGPVYFTPSMNSVIDYVHKFNLTLVPFNDTSFLTFEPHTGAVFPARQMINLAMAPLLKAALLYTKYRSQYEKAGQLNFGYLIASENPDLFLPISDWLERKELNILKPAFRIIMTQEGYGAIDDTPVLYALKFVSRESLIDVILNPSGGLLAVYEGYDVLAKKMAEGLNVKLGQEVVRIKRKNGDGDPVMVVTMTSVRGDLAINIRTNVYNCQKVILAFPPLLPYLGNVLMDMSLEERDILGQVKCHKYASALHQIPNWDGTMYASVGAIVSRKVSRRWMGNGNAILFGKQSMKKLKHVYSSYSWLHGDFDDLPSVEDLRLMNDKLQKILRKIGGRNWDLVRTFVKPMQRHPYFPHVNSTALRQGFYQKFDKIQGHKGLYYATTLLGFECMDLAIKMSEEFVNKYF